MMPEEQVLFCDGFDIIHKNTNKLVSSPFYVQAVFSDNITGQILRYYPVTIEAVQSFWQNFEFALDRFVGIGDTSRIGATDNTDYKCGDFNALLFANLKIPDNVNGCPRRDECDPVHFFF